MAEFAIKRETPIKLERRVLPIFNLINNQPQNNLINRRVVLNSLPNGSLSIANFNMEALELPVISAQEILLRTLYLSLDIHNYADAQVEPIAVGTAISGKTVARVEASQHPDYKVGDVVLSSNGWQDFAISDGQSLIKLDAQIPHPSLSLGVLGIPGFIAYIGLLDIGRPQVGETLIVTAASGAIGSVVGQIGKLKGCRVVGIADGIEQCRYVTEELGFDACINSHDGDLTEKLAASCLHGIDIYFQSLHGDALDAALPLLNVNARIPLCGTITHHIKSKIKTTRNEDRFNELKLTRTLLNKNIKMQSFTIFDAYGTHFSEFFKQMSEWVKSGKIKYCENIVDGLQNASEAFIDLSEDKNTGHLIVRLA